MRGYLLDTVILSELRKKNRNAAVVGWFKTVAASDLYLSVLAVGECPSFRANRRCDSQPIRAC
jgi:predicted nucleic acid-binding protein